MAPINKKNISIDNVEKPILVENLKLLLPVSLLFHFDVLVILG